MAIAATIALRSLAAYGLHVLAHKSSWLWRVHRVHHADTAVDLSTGFRHHPLELLYVATCYLALAVLLGLSPAALIAYEGAAVLLSLWTHANLRLPSAAERLLGTVLVTPALHHVHHSAHQPETDSNYGELFSVWDRLFGTLKRLDVDQLRAMRPGLGSDHDIAAPHLGRQLLLPLRDPPQAIAETV
jgi:sterol desaturase/sphingolipid hydroxylase (fatty acid hydroxylase superfamily)